MSIHSSDQWDDSKLNQGGMFYSTYLSSAVHSYHELADRICYDLGYPMINLEVHGNQIFTNIARSIEMFTKFAGYTEEYLVVNSDFYERGYGIQVDKVLNRTPELTKISDPDKAGNISYKQVESKDFEENVSTNPNTRQYGYKVIRNDFIGLYENVRVESDLLEYIVVGKVDDAEEQQISKVRFRINQVLSYIYILESLFHLNPDAQTPITEHYFDKIEADPATPIRFELFYKYRDLDLDGEYEIRAGENKNEYLIESIERPDEQYILKKTPKDVKNGVKRNIYELTDKNSEIGFGIIRDDSIGNGENGVDIYNESQIESSIFNRIYHLIPHQEINTTKNKLFDVSIQWRKIDYAPFEDGAITISNVHTGENNLIDIGVTVHTVRSGNVEMERYECPVNVECKKLKLNNFDELSNQYRKVIDLYSFEEGSNSGIYNLFTIEQTLAQQTYFSYALGNYGFDLVSWYILKQWLEVRSKMLGIQRQFKFDERNQIIQFTPEPRDNEQFYGVMGAYLEKPIFDVIKEPWVLQYAIALTKINVGRARGKYQGSQLFGGGTLDASLLQEGITEKKELEELIFNITPGFGDGNPPKFFVG